MTLPSSSLGSLVSPLGVSSFPALFSSFTSQHSNVACAPAVAFIVRRKISELDDVQGFGFHAECHDHASRILHRNHHTFHSKSRVRSSTLRFSVPGREPRFSRQLTPLRCRLPKLFGGVPPTQQDHGTACCHAPQREQNTSSVTSPLSRTANTTCAGQRTSPFCLPSFLPCSPHHETPRGPHQWQPAARAHSSATEKEREGRRQNMPYHFAPAFDSESGVWSMNLGLSDRTRPLVSLPRTLQAETRSTIPVST